MSARTIEAAVDSTQLGNFFHKNEGHAAGAVLNRGSDPGKQLTTGDFFGGYSAHGSGSMVFNGHADKDNIAAFSNRNKNA